MTLPGALVSGEWLAAHHREVRVVDVRWYLDGRSGLDAYQSGHIPGALWLDIDADLAAPASMALGRHPMPHEADFAEVLGRVGIAAGTPVVAYDDSGGSIASRLWWMLHTLGEPVAVLDGGLAAWPGELSTELPVPIPVVRPVRQWPAHRYLTADQVAAAVRAGARLYDARTAVRFAEGDPSIDPRPGHVPGAQSAPWAGNLDDTGCFRPVAELAARYSGDGPAIAYCGSGVTACHDLLAMHLAGQRDLALYTGSWSQWGADPSRPAQTGG
jgi:thiosulfate/3-mercaptopyruvate sulfurtransferase